MSIQTVEPLQSVPQEIIKLNKVLPISTLVQDDNTTQMILKWGVLSRKVSLDFLDIDYRTGFNQVQDIMYRGLQKEDLELIIIHSVLTGQYDGNLVGLNERNPRYKPLVLKSTDSLFGLVEFDILCAYNGYMTVFVSNDILKQVETFKNNLRRLTL